MEMWNLLSILLNFGKLYVLHTPYANVRLQDLNEAYSRTPNDWNLQGLIDISNYSKNIASESDKCVSFLTKDRGNCLSQNCNSSVELTIHLVGTVQKYLMLEILLLTL